MDAQSAARAWAHGWATAWRAKDADAVGALYADDAVFRSHPFRDPHLGSEGARGYAAWALSQEDDVPADVRFGEPVVDGDRAAVEYWAVVRAEGKEHTIAGIAVLRFDADGRVVQELDYWAMDEGRREAPEGWGR